MREMWELGVEDESKREQILEQLNEALDNTVHASATLQIWNKRIEVNINSVEEQ